MGGWVGGRESERGQFLCVFVPKLVVGIWNWKGDMVRELRGAYKIIL